MLMTVIIRLHKRSATSSIDFKAEETPPRRRRFLAMMGHHHRPACYAKFGDANMGHGISVGLIATKIRPAYNPGEHLSLQEQKKATTRR